jgi:hypothetical protein
LVKYLRSNTLRRHRGWRRLRDHLGCRHFIVVFVGCDAAKRMFTRIYSSESRRWSEVDSAKSLSLPIHGNGDLQFDQPVLAGNALYFLFRRPDGIKYDLVTEKLSEIDLPDAISWRVVLTNTEDGVRFALVEAALDSACGHGRLQVLTKVPAGGHKPKSLSTRRYSLLLIGTWCTLMCLVLRMTLGLFSCGRRFLVIDC